ncbi:MULTISPECIES: DUF1403 family protein [Rhizobium]|uniref:DUF1403 family protein n=1 Tax=Rhizobium tropici TaxID=398 RepID=A0A6P1C8X4_RHITR|nr:MULTISPECIES: DUF1403 family protein [Rhizobium]MBB4243612.1 hypothetical protein [Rhizobium tropici]MBB5595939.1 hypothetical protein [Rhizobium tropici]MBB6493932.1 hypothetical protein [Rhizobium tropici]NEV11364.1 DUF1403 family protein [Rhizobium tropici]TGE93143.1 DUF1403 domain-containing protein [Rhizobium sp. SEMIA 4088]
MTSRARIIPDAPLSYPPVPVWARLPATAEGVGDAGYFAGAALAALHPAARDGHPLGNLWRQRLALGCAAAMTRQQGRPEGETTLRDHWYLTPADGDPGPAGRLLGAFRALGEPRAVRTQEWETRLPNLFEIAADASLVVALEMAADHARGPGDGVRAAASAALAFTRRRPDARSLGVWLADAILASRLGWPAPLPILANALRPGDWRALREGRAEIWTDACHFAYGRGAAAALDLHADLGRRMTRLLAVAPQLRGKEADTTISILIREDALAAKTGKATSDRSSRRLFDRLVTLGGVRELTGRTTFRLYGL